jgi:hypothetical protein
MEEESFEHAPPTWSSRKPARSASASRRLLQAPVNVPMALEEVCEDGGPLLAVGFGDAIK